MMKFNVLSGDHYQDLVEIFSELEQYYFAEKAASTNEIEEYLKNGLFAEHSGVQVMAAYDQETVVGFATYSILYPAPRLSGQLFMKDLFVSSTVRGQGVGVNLMKKLAQYAQSKGCRRMDWTAESTNPRAGEFYRSIGARLVSEKEYYRFEGDALFEFAEG